ncbi:MAG: hypothetical protein KDJ65_33065 [Anaerolineae bacterium]|nr:hypothetical protein [Anaerolineae bacterium]
MKTRTLSIIVTSITVVLLAAGVAGATSNWTLPSPIPLTAAVSSGISYQGRLFDSGGTPLNGTYSLRFVVYDKAVAGSALWDSGNLNVTIDDGLFNVKLGIDQTDVNGQALWLSIIVQGQTLSPRQEILPAPYALSLRPGADIVGDSIGANDATLAGYAPATGTALYADANGGTGLVGDSENSYGIWGSSNNSWGGYFTSDGGYGIRVDTNGTDHYDHGAYVTSTGGYGVYATSAQNQGVRGEAGNVSGISQPLGTVGVVGIGQSRGMYGASGNGIGTYGTSQGNYGVWGQSNTYRGVTGRTSRVDNNYGFYTPDNLFAANVNISGAVMAVMQNSGDESLSPGDVVIFSGMNTSITGVDGPLVQVSKANQANSTAVAGVVFSRFNIDAINPDLELPDGSASEKSANLDVTPAGSAPPNDYVLVVVQGPAQVKASALGSGDIQPGDLLSTGSTAGLAEKAAAVTTNGIEVAPPGTIFAKALEPVTGKEEMIYVYVTLQ